MNTTTNTDIQDEELLEQAENVLEQALATLPATSRGIAEFLRRKGIHGKRMSRSSCPIANWCREILDRDGLFREVRILINASNGVIQMRNAFLLSALNYVVLRRNIEVFIKDFDESNRYKFLLPE